MASHRIPTHHPSDEMLLDYASGAQAPALALFCATHLALCPSCRSEVGRLEALGGIMLEEIDPLPVEADSLDRLMTRLSEPEPLPAPAREPVPIAGPGRHVPRPLRDSVPARRAARLW